MEPDMMRSAVIAMMVATMMILRTAAYPGYPGTTAELKLDTTTEGTTAELKLDTTTEGTTTELKLDTTTEQLTPASFTCPPIECDGPNCYLEKEMSYCGQCICSDPICMRVSCGPDEQCVPNEYNSYDYTCVSTTTSDSTTPTPTPTPVVCTPPSCYQGCDLYLDSDGCPSCDGCPLCGDMMPCDETTTPPPTPSVTPTVVCTMVTCLEGPFCYMGIDSNGCPTCDCSIGWLTSTPYPPPPCPPPQWCFTDYCQLKTILDGCLICECPADDSLCTIETCVSSQDCNPNYECYNGKCYACDYGPTTETPTPPTPETPTWPPTETPTWPPTETPTWTTTETPTWTTPELPTLPNCPDASGCACRLEYSPGEECPMCICYEPPCMFFSPCGSDEECVVNPDDLWDYTCVPKNEPTLTTETVPTPTPSVTPTVVCPMVTCRLDCDRVIDSNGCPTCDCDIDPCTGTPNPGRCGRGSKTRWTYNSLTDTCESFRYYGCTPSPNTFRSRKECKNKCSGNSQIDCPDLACPEDSCYTLERKNKCPLCICPNPCKGFKCRRGYECKMRESKCNRDPKPFCAKTP